MKSNLPAVPFRYRQRMPNVLKAMSEMENEMERWMQSAGAWPEEMQGFDFSPSCNLKETTKDFVVEFEVPGIKKEEIKIEIENRRLTVSGERKKQKEEKDEKHFLSESFYGSFMRSFNLPAPVDENRIEASCQEGILTIKLPKSQQTKAKEVKVH